MVSLLTITFCATLLAIAMSIVAWRASRHEQLRAEARIADLAAEIHGAPGVAMMSADTPDLFTHMRNGGSLGSAGTAGSAHWGLALVAGVLAIAAAAALVVVFSGESRSASVGRRSAVPVVRAAQTAAQPLELIALTHERDGDRLTVRGVIRNPRSGAEIDQLAAVVLLFSRDGGFLTSGRALVDARALNPGAETPFVVTVPGATDVGRYRVSFRTDEQVMPHVDRRSGGNVTN